MRDGGAVEVLPRACEAFGCEFGGARRASANVFDLREIERGDRFALPVSDRMAEPAIGVVGENGVVESALERCNKSTRAEHVEPQGIAGDDRHCIGRVDRIVRFGKTARARSGKRIAHKRSEQKLRIIGLPRERKRLRGRIEGLRTSDAIGEQIRERAEQPRMIVRLDRFSAT